MSPYRLAPSPAHVAPWRWTRPRVVDALGLWRWAWGRRWGGGRWAVYAVVRPREMTTAEMHAQLAAYTGGPDRYGYAEGMWDDALTVRWRPVAACPHGPLRGDDMGLRGCDCEVWS